MSARRRGPLRRYFHRHPVHLDVLVVVAYLLLAAGSLTRSTPAWDGSGWIAWAAVGLSGAALLLRRKSPLPVAALLCLLAAVSLTAVPLGQNVSISLWFALYTVALAYPARTALAAACLLSAPVIAALSIGLPGALERLEVGSGGAHRAAELALAGWVVGAVVLLSNVVSAGIGITVRRNRQHEEELREWSERNALLASAGERNRIAREMHDVVAHSLTVMIALSDGAGVVLKRDQQQAAEVLAELSATGRTALADMRRVLGVLREEADAPRQPLPDSGSLAALAARFRAAGLPVRLAVAGPALPADDAFRLTVYRIVQESLTNVLRYGKAVTAVEVAVVRDGSRVRIRIADDGRGGMVDDDGAPAAGNMPAGVGQGIKGMRERAAIYSGSLACGPRASGGWLVEAVLAVPDGPAVAGKQYG